MENIDREINRIKNLKQNKSKTQEELSTLAKDNLQKQEILDSLTFCINDEEKKFASNLLQNYLAESSLTSFAERDTLRQLIDLEVIMERVKAFINSETAKANPVPPTNMLEQLQYLNKQIMEMKEKLGLSQKEDQKIILDEWRKLKDKALAYYKENAGCNVVKCPECKKLFMILKNMKDCHEEKLPLFKKTVLYSKKLFELYELNRITKEEISIILGVSNDYIDFIFENTYKNDKNDR